MNGWRSTLPQGTSFEGPMRRVPEIEFLYDLTYRHRGETRFEQQIFEKNFQLLNQQSHLL